MRRLDRTLPLLLALAACGPLNRQIDHLALASMAVRVQRNQDVPQAPLPFLTLDGLERASRPTMPVVVQAAPETQLRLQDERLVQEVLTFESAVKLRHPESDRAVVHVWRRGPLGARPVVLWVPGLSIGAGDWPSLSHYFERVLEAGADVLLYEPPYHFSRAPAGMDSGDAVLSTDFADHLSSFVQALSDLRRLLPWLRAQGVNTLGAFGSSMGAGLLMRLATLADGLDFLILKQPLVDWNTVLARAEMAPVRERIEKQGVAPEVMAQAYRALDSRPEKPRLPADRIALLYGRFDEIAPEEVALSLAEAWGISHVIAYPRGHSLITVGGAPYRDVPRLLREDLEALRFSRRGHPVRE